MDSTETTPSGLPGNSFNPRPSNVPIPKRFRSFLGAFLEALEQLARENYFAQSVGDECPDGYVYSWNSEAVERRLALYDYDIRWPLGNDDLRYLSDAEVLKYAEFFYRLVSMPLDEWEHDYCGASHAKGYDEAQGQVEYTRRVNVLFKRWNP